MDLLNNMHKSKTKTKAKQKKNCIVCTCVCIIHTISEIEASICHVFELEHELNIANQLRQIARSIEIKGHEISNVGTQETEATCAL